MTQRSALLITAGLTTFVLIVLGGLGAYLAQPPAAPAPAPAAATDAAPPNSGSADPVATQAAVYQQALQDARTQLDEANRRLAAANAQLRLAQTPTAPPPPVASTAAPAAPTDAVSAPAAAQAALALAPGATLTSRPEVVSYRGTAAYEVRLDRGTVYVDAGSGQILYNGVAPAVQAPAPVAGQAPTGYDQENDAGGGDN